MISDLVSFLDFPQDDFGVGGDVLPDHKKGRMDIVLLQQIEDFVRLGGMRSVVERESDFLRIGLAGYDNACLLYTSDAADE